MILVHSRLLSFSVSSGGLEPLSLEEGLLLRGHKLLVSQVIVVCFRWMTAKLFHLVTYKAMLFNARCFDAFQKNYICNRAPVGLLCFLVELFKGSVLVCNLGTQCVAVRIDSTKSEKGHASF